MEKNNCNVYESGGRIAFIITSTDVTYTCTNNCKNFPIYDYKHNLMSFLQ